MYKILIHNTFVVYIFCSKNKNNDQPNQTDTKSRSIREAIVRDNAQWINGNDTNILRMT